MRFNYIQLMCDLGYKVKKDESENIIWFQKKIDNYTFKNIIIDFNKKLVSCETDYYLKNGNLGKREGNMTFDEFNVINGILESGL